ncbi:unnamed protein product, partial [Hapterophycus canaliculatus]
FSHAVVWNPIAGVLEHASGVSSSEEITTHTGTLALSPIANRIARGDVDARTGREWDPPLDEAVGREGGARKRVSAHDRGRLGGPLAGVKRKSKGPAPSTAPLAAQNGQSDTPVPHDTNNYSTHGFNKLPDVDEDYRTWTVPQLREFLIAFRCLDNAGTSVFNKRVLATLAADVVRLIRVSGLIGKNLAFRHPTPDLRTFEDKVASLMPDLPAQPKRIKEWVALRRYMPEISKSVIVGFLQEVNPLAGEGTRVWYRAEQRVLDMGNLSRLWGTPSKAGIMWLGTSAGASFSGDKEYRVHVKLRTEELEVSADTAMEEEEQEGDAEMGQAPRTTKTVVALKVDAAICECPAGLSGGCSHVAMVLFLCRLLQMNEHELATFNPSTCTGRACAWIMQHSEGSRSAR